jgi:predicted O-methyltransferase YrrM
MAGTDYEAWFGGATFTTDWTSHHFARWQSILTPRRGFVTDVLEVGSWEGRSAIFWLNFFVASRVTCIDTFAGSVEHHLAHAEKLTTVEQRFDTNVACYGSRVEKIRADSMGALPSLGVAGRRFDFVYLDGSHRSVDVYADACLAWPMVRRGGALLFDDYTWTDLPDEHDRPKLGIDSFLAAAEGTYREIHRDLQVLIEKS